MADDGPYLEIIDARDGERALKTGIGAMFDAFDKARAAFDAIPAVETGGFLVDLHDADGSLLDTVHVDEAGFEALTGEEPGTIEDHAAHDKAYWTAARARARGGS